MELVVEVLELIADDGEEMALEIEAFAAHGPTACTERSDVSFFP